MTCTAADKCVSCNANKFRKLDTSLCICMDGYYEVTSDNAELCKVCHYSCKTCEAANSCVTCASDRSLDTTCKCKAKTYEDSAKQTC